MQSKFERRKKLQNSCSPNESPPRPIPKILLSRLPEEKRSDGNQLKSNNYKLNYVTQPGFPGWDESVIDKYRQGENIAKSSHDESLSCQSEVNQLRSSSTEEEPEINIPSEDEGGVTPIQNKKDQSQITKKQQPSYSQVMCQSEFGENIQEQNYENQDLCVDNYSNNEIPKTHYLPTQPISTYSHVNASQPIIRTRNLLNKPIHRTTITGNIKDAPQNPTNLKTVSQKLLSLAADGQLSVVAPNQLKVVSRDLKMFCKDRGKSSIDLNTRKVVSVDDQPNITQYEPSPNQNPVQLLDRQPPEQRMYVEDAIPNQLTQRPSASPNTVQSFGSKELPEFIVHSQPHPEMKRAKYNSSFNQNQYQSAIYNNFSQEQFGNTNLTNNYSYQHNRMGLNANVLSRLQRIILQNRHSQQNHQQPQQGPTSQETKKNTTSPLATSTPPKAKQVLLTSPINGFNEPKLQPTSCQSVLNLENSLNNVTASAGLTDRCMAGEVILPNFVETSGSNAVMKHKVSANPDMVADETFTQTMTASYGTGISTGINITDSTEVNTITDERREQSEVQQMLDQFASVIYSFNTTLCEAIKIHNTLGGFIHQATDMFQKLIDSVQKFDEQHNADEFEMTPEGHTTDGLTAEVPPREFTANENRHTNNPVNKVLSKKPTVPVLPLEYDPNDTKWTLRHKVDKQGLVELMPQTGILVNHNELLYCVNESKDCKSLAQLLLPIVFNKNALGVCSTFVEKAHGTDVGSTRPELDENAMSVLLSYVLDYGQRNNLTADIKPILQAIHNKIQEFRFEYRLAKTNKKSSNLK